MRMRLFEVMGAALQAFRTGPTVSCQFDGTYLNESLTGNRARSRTGMPRRPHRNGESDHARGISREKVCVVCAANDLGDEFAAVCGRGRPTDAGLRGSLAGVVDGSWVSTDDHASYARVLPSLGVAEHVATATRDARGGELELVDAMHQRLKIFLAPFHGVSTRWLGRYLDCFRWLEQARHSDADRGGDPLGPARGRQVRAHEARPHRRAPAALGLLGGEGVGQSWSSREIGICRAVIQLQIPIV